MARETQQTTARLEARLPNNLHALLKRTAEIEGRTLTDFVVSAAREAACRTIEATEILRPLFCVRLHLPRRSGKRFGGGANFWARNDGGAVSH